MSLKEAALFQGEYLPTERGTRIMIAHCIGTARCKELYGGEEAGSAALCTGYATCL